MQGRSRRPPKVIPCMAIMQPATTGSRLRQYTALLSRGDLERWPIIGRAAKSAGTIFVDRASKKSGARAVVYYYGYGSMRIVVALRDLGTGPFTKSGGTVIKFDGRDHTISIKNDSGAVESFKIESNTVADTRQGAVSGSKYQPAKGTKVQLIATQVNGSPTAMFIESN